MDDAREQRSRKLRGVLAIALLAIAMGTVMQALGWAQTSYFSLTRAFSEGTTQIDEYRWETRDESYTAGHYYSVKAPGLSLATLPWYATLKGAGAEGVSRRMADTAHQHEAYRWYRAGVPSGLYGNKLTRAREVRQRIADYTPLVWMVGLVGTVLPALLMMLLVRTLGERLEPGFGTAAALALGAGTLVLPFATLLFGHVLSALLGFACFALLWHERAGPPRLRLVALAGLLAGLAVTTEYPLALVGAICGIYAISRGDAVRRGLAFSGGVLAGVLPLLAYNLWAFGSITDLSYANAVAEWGITGHDVLGMNDSGFFGVGAPSLRDAFDLLFASKGLFVLSPVLAMGVVGAVIAFRRGRRAEMAVVGGVCAAFLLYNAAYWLPFGGGSPGPRFLIPMLPFLALPLATAWRRYPATTLALAIPSVVMMTAATLTQPMIGNGDVGLWLEAARDGNFTHTLATVFGSDNDWASLVPFFAPLAVAAGLALSVTPRVTIGRDAWRAFAALLAWTAIALVAPNVPANEAGADHGVLELILFAAVLALAAVLTAVVAERFTWSRRSAAAFEGNA